MLSYFKKSFSYLEIALNQVMPVSVGGGDGCSVLKRGSEIINCGKQHGFKVAILFFSFSTTFFQFLTMCIK